MCIEYNECHYGGTYNVYVKIIFVITEIVRMNEKTGTGVSSEKENVKESQSQSQRDTSSTPHRVPGWGRYSESCQLGKHTRVSFPQRWNN